MKLVVVSDAGFAAAVDRALGVAADGAPPSSSSSSSSLPSSSSSVQAQNDAPHVEAALAALGHDVVSVVVGGEDRDARDLARLVDPFDDGAGADLVVNLCDSYAGDPQLAALVPAFLDAHGVRHTGGDAFATALCKHKDHVKLVLQAQALPTPRWQVIGAGDDVAAFSLTLEPPVILKLCGEHASVGIDEGSVCFDEAAVRKKAAALLARHRQSVLVEEYVAGREFYVSCVGRPLRALPLMEHTFSGLPLRTFEKKWMEKDPIDVDARFARPVPLRAPSAPFSGSVDSVFEVAAAALDAVGWRDWGRVDLRIDKGGVPLIIDVTPMTYLHPDAPCARAAAAAGLSYVDLWRVIVEGARS